MITGGESRSKILERRAASYGVNPKIHGPQMHKHTKLGKCKLILETVHWPLIFKTKAFVIERNGHWWHINGGHWKVWFFTLGICMYKGVGEDSGHEIG